MVDSRVAVKSSAYLCSHGRSERSSDHAALCALMPLDRHERSRTRQHVGDALGVSSTSYSEDQTAPFEQ